MKLAGIILVMTCWVGTGSAECFHTLMEAALGRGVQDGVGFRLEGVKVDRIGGGAWAKVASCLHPERPGVAVQVPAESGGEGPEKVAAVQAVAVLVKAGQGVSVLRVERWARVETAGIVQEAGGLGARVRVRLAGVESGTEARFVEAIVRSDGLVEVEAGR